MEHKPLIERLWGIVRTHRFAVFESCLQQACPDGSLQALSGVLRHLAASDEHELAQALLSETLHNHVASAQIFWRLPLLLLLGEPGRSGGAEGLDLAAFETEVQALVRAGRLDAAIEQVAAVLRQGDCPALYELLGRLQLRRAAEQAPLSAAPAAPAVSAPPPEAVRPTPAPPPEPEPVATEKTGVEVMASSRKLAAELLRARAEAQASGRMASDAARPPVEPAARPAPSVAKAPSEARPAPAAKPAPAAVAPAAEPARWVAEELLKAQARAQEVRREASESAKPPVEPTARPAPSVAKAPSEPRPAPAAKPAPAAVAPAAEPARWVAEELLKAQARAQEVRREASESAKPAAAKPEAVARPAPAAAEPAAEAAPMASPAPDETKEQVFARLREGFAKLGKVERKVLAWVMANPNQNVTQIARSIELGNAEVASALKGLTGLWLDPFTFAGYTVRDYVMECMSKGKQQAPVKAKSAAKAERGAAQTPARASQTPVAAARVARTEPTPSPAVAAEAVSPAKSLRANAALAVTDDMSALDLRVLQYIGSHPGCSPDEVMEAMGPDEPASVSLVTLRRDWLDRNGEGRYRIKPDMLERIPSGDRPLPSARVEVDAEVEVAPAAPSRPRPAEPAPRAAASVPAAAAAPSAKETARLAKLPKGQRQILAFLRDNTQARTKDIARALDQDAAGVNSALLGPLGEHVSVVHSFWRLNDGVGDSLDALETAEAS